MSLHMIIRNPSDSRGAERVYSGKYGRMNFEDVYRDLPELGVWLRRPGFKLRYSEDLDVYKRYGDCRGGISTSQIKYIAVKSLIEINRGNDDLNQELRRELGDNYEASMRAFIMRMELDVLPELKRVGRSKLLYNKSLKAGY